MRKMIKVWVLFVVVMLCMAGMATVSGCIQGEDPKNSSPEESNSSSKTHEVKPPASVGILSSEEVSNIRQAYFDAWKESGAYDQPTVEESVEMVYVQKYLGSYENGVVLAIYSELEGMHATVEVEIYVGDVFICTATAGWECYLYKNYEEGYAGGEFVALERAYEDGEVTKANLNEIAALAQA